MKIERDEGGAGSPRRRNEESSVVFSLANLRQIAEADAQRSARTRAGAMPSFAGTELSGLAQPQPAPMVLPIARPVLAPAPSNLPLLLMLGILLLTTIALGAYVVVTPQPQVVITRVVAPEAAPRERAPQREPVVVAAPLEEVAPPLEVPAVDPPTEPQPKTVVRPRTRSESHERRNTERTVTPEPQPKTERRGEVPLECVLDPNLPRCGGKQATPPPVDPGKTRTAIPSLPETLGNSQIRDGIAAVKATAKMCGGKHGGSAGEKVRVKLSIVGATGAVSSTTAEDPHRGTALGNCVAAALKKATFPQFRKSVIGVEYTITL